MDDAAVARLVLDPRDVHVLGQACRHHEAAVDVSTRGRDLEIGPDVQDQIGSPFQGPVLRKLTGRRQVGGVALGSSSFRPGREGGDVRRGERAVVLELRAHVRRGFPGGH